MKYFLAIDIGASSGRHIIGYKKNNKLLLDEVYRFKNGVIKKSNHLIWDIDYLFNEVKNGIKEAFKKYKKIESLSIDTWGVDYVLLNKDKIIYPVYSYRDSRTKDVINKVHKIIAKEKLYKLTGIQFQEFNSIYQLYWDKLNGRLKTATDFLMIPEYLSYLLTGIKVKEYSNATTTGLVNATTKKYENSIIKKLGLPTKLFTNLTNPGKKIGKLKKDIVNEVGGNLNVILCASHDTASAFEAIETTNKDIILSSGTWSLIGTKIKNPSITKEGLNTNFTNEGGINYYRYLKNIMGMWIINQTIKDIKLDFNKIVKQAEKSKYEEVFDVNDKSLVAPKNMKNAIVKLLAKKKSLPKNDGDLYRSIYKSLALSYKNAIKEVESNLNKKYNKIYIIGGGAKNNFLNKLTEIYTKKKVIALPIEATAIGNLKVQMRRIENE